MLVLDGDNLTIDDVVLVAQEEAGVASLDEATQARMKVSQKWVDETVRQGDTVIYGVNTGFGPLATTRIRPEQANKLSRNLILNCLAGVGKPLPREVVRAMMVVRANSLVKGYSGVRPVLVNTLIQMLNKGVTPFVPEKGSLGASGDLAPLAHIAVVFTQGDEDETSDFSGQAYYRGRLLSGAEAMKAAGIPRVVLEAKEGLALTNGTTFMAAAGSLAVKAAENLVAHAEVASALSFEALQGISSALDPAIHGVNGQPGQVQIADDMLKLLEGSQLMDSAVDKVQDAYSLRCTPQVLGPIKDVLRFLRARFNAIVNAASDNPLIFPAKGGEGFRAISGGNFHGAGPAMWLDFLGIAIAEAGNIAERRIFRMLTPELNGGLPSMLVQTSGLDSGLMIPQYTAAALVSDNKTLAHPDSVDSIPSSANQEDHVSMGANAARHTLEILDNVRRIIAIEFMTAAQAIDLRPDGPGKLGRGTSAAYRAIREKVDFLSHDRETSSDIETLAELIKTGAMLRKAWPSEQR